MATKVVTGKLTTPDGVAIAGGIVSAVLSVPAVIAGTLEVVPAAVQTKSALDGTYSLTLQANADLNPVGYYTIIQTIPNVWVSSTFTIVVPQTAGPFPISTIMTSPVVGPVWDATLLHLAGTEHVTGQKIFDTNPVLNAAAFPESAVANLTADLAAKAADASVVHLAGAETLTGVKIGAFVDKGGAVYNAKAFGVTFDGVTDDTAAWQTFADFITGKSPAIVGGFGRRGVLPGGVSVVSSAGAGTPCVNFSLRPGWWIQGQSPVASVVRCATDNAPIFNLGSDTDSTMHSWGIDGLQFDYLNSQPSTNTTANPILFSQMGSEGSLTNLSFARGSYAIRVASGITCPWGTFWNNLNFGSGLTGGAMDWSASASNGVPNNVWGRMFVTATNMVGPIFKSIYGYNWTIDAIEIITASLGPQLITFRGPSQVTIGAIKLEGGAYSATTVLVEAPVASRIKLGQFKVMTITVSGATTVLTGIALGRSGGGVLGYLNVDDVSVGATSISGGAIAVAVELGAGHPGIIGQIDMTNGWALQDNAGTGTAGSLKVLAWNMGTLSGNRGDADYTVALGDPTKNTFETTLTAQRTINLPAVLNNTTASLYYEFRLYGAINGANTVLVKCNGVTLATLATDKVVVGFTQSRRSVSVPQTNWLMTKYETLP